MHEDEEEDDVVVFQSEAIIDFAYLSEEPREDREWSRLVLQLSLTRGPATWGKDETRLILLLQLYEHYEHLEIIMNNFEGVVIAIIKTSGQVCKSRIHGDE